jgi:hypothetical protein
MMLCGFRKHLYGAGGDVDVSRSVKVDEREMLGLRDVQEVDLYPEDFLLFPLSVPSFSYATIEQEKEEVFVTLSSCFLSSFPSPSPFRLFGDLFHSL